MYGQTMMDSIADTYRFLPLCSVIDGKVFVTHGGLTRFAELTLDYISKYFLIYFTYLSVF